MRAITGTISWISSFFSGKANQYVASLAYPLSTRLSDTIPWLSAISLSVDHPTVSKNTLKWMKENYPDFVWANIEKEVDFEPEAQSYIVQPHARDQVSIKGEMAISKVEVDRLNRQHSIGGDIDRYPPRVFLEVKSSKFTGCAVELKGVIDCCFTLTAPSRPQPAIQDHDARLVSDPQIHAKPTISPARSSTASDAPRTASIVPQEPASVSTSSPHTTTTANSTSSTHTQKPTLPQLINLHNRRGETINIMQRVGTQYTDLGLILLNDEDGSIVEQITSEYQLNAVNITREILKRWIRGEGKQPVTWKTLTDTLAAIGLTELVKSIQESL